MVEAVMLWNEPNNLSHWNFHLDPNWERFAAMLRSSAAAIRALNPKLKIVLGGVSSCDWRFIELMQSHGALADIDVVAVHGFPLDWNHWSVNDWPERIRETQKITDKPVWVSEVGASSFGAEEVQLFGLERMSALLDSLVERIHWYSLFDLPPTWEATTRHKEAEGSSYYRHYYMGLLRHDGTPKLAAAAFPRREGLGLCQWFHYEDHRLEMAVEWMRRLGVKYLRTGVSWADWFRPNAEVWFDRQMKALEEFETTMTLCFTPDHLGLEPHWTSPPVDIETFTEFACWAVSRYAPVQQPQSSLRPEEAMASL
jgi:beta-xylosidase